MSLESDQQQNQQEQESTQLSWYQTVSYQGTKKNLCESFENIQNTYQTYLGPTINSVPQKWNNFYDNSPQQITDWKVKHFIDKDCNTRVLGIAFASVVLAIISKKALNQSTLGSIRTGLIGYGGLGIFIVPEVFNPFVIECKECKNYEK